jgi:hypothetical protein
MADTAQVVINLEQYRRPRKPARLSHLLQRPQAGAG